MRMIFLTAFQRARTLAVVLVGLALLGPWAEAQAGNGPAVLDHALAPLAEVPAYRTASLDRPALADEDEQRQLQGLPYRFADQEVVALSCDNCGRWETTDRQDHVWRLRIQAPGALSLNLGFALFDLPEGGRLSLYPADLRGPDDPRGVRIFTGGDATPEGQLWTPVVLTDDAVLELYLPPGARYDFRLELTAINKGYRDFGEPQDPGQKSGDCNIDILCPEGEDWLEDAAAVGVYTVNGFWKCSGSLINNVRQDSRPLFLTADHCGIDQNNDASIVVYWNYQSPNCGQHGGGTLNESQRGATLLANYSGPYSDFALIELDDPLDPDYDLRLAGWNRRDALPTNTVCIHHPSTDEKSISFDDDPPTVTTYLGDSTPGDGTHLRIGAWDLGTTEAGSSGSPLFDQNHHIVGQLHGGWASCENTELPDWFGRLYVSWEGGGTPDTRLKDWLDPDDTGAETLSLLNPASSVVPSDDLSFSGRMGGPFTPVSGTYLIKNIGVQAIDFEVTTDVAWLAIGPASGSLLVGENAEITIMPGTEAYELLPGDYSAVVTFTNLTNHVGDTTREVTLKILPAILKIVSVVPNPFIDFTVCEYVLPRQQEVTARILNLRGMVVRDFGTFVGEAGTNELAWNGLGDSGRPQPSGAYVLLIETGGQTIRASLTHAH